MNRRSLIQAAVVGGVAALVPSVVLAAPKPKRTISPTPGFLEQRIHVIEDMLNGGPRRRGALLIAILHPLNAMVDFHRKQTGHISTACLTHGDLVYTLILHQFDGSEVFDQRLYEEVTTNYHGLMTSNLPKLKEVNREWQELKDEDPRLLGRDYAAMRDLFINFKRTA